MLELINEPKKLISGTTYSRIISANNKAVFEWQRKDFTVDGSTLNYHNEGGLLALETDTLVTLAAGDLVYLNSSVLATGYYVAQGMTPDGTKIVLDTAYQALGSTDWIFIPNYRANYYVEVRVTDEDLGIGIVKASADSEGVVSVDLKGLFRLVVSDSDSNTYAFEEGELAAVETVDSDGAQNVVIAAREVYQGGSTAWVNLDDDYMVIDAALPYGEVNLREYVSAKITKPYPVKLLTHFAKVRQWQLYPLDIQALYFANVAGGSLEWRAQLKGLNNGNIGSEETLTINDAGLNQKLLRLPAYLSRPAAQTKIWYDAAKCLYSLTDTISGQRVELMVERDNACQKNPIYVKWRNSLGGWSYWLFSSNTPQSIDGDDAEEALMYEPVSGRERALGVLSREVITLAADNLTDRTAWFDFVNQKNVYVLKSGLFGETASYTTAGNKITITSEGHGLKDGDTFQVLFDTNYQDNYTVESYTDDTFTFDLGSLHRSFASRSKWRKVIEPSDWVLHVKENDATSYTREAQKFGITFDLRKPSNPYRL